jgi:hypothetical protein
MNIYSYAMIFFSEIYIQVIWTFFSFIVVMGGVTLWHLHRFLCIKYITHEFTSPTILLQLPTRLSSCLSFLSLSSYTHAFFTQSLYILYILLIYLLDLHSISYVTFLLYWLCTLMHRNFDIVQFFYFSFCSLCFCVMSKKWSLTSLMFFSLFFSDFYSFSFTFKSLIHSELIFV